jgi:hypothetical protein
MLLLVPLDYFDYFYGFFIFVLAKLLYQFLYCFDASSFMDQRYDRDSFYKIPSRFLNGQTQLRNHRHIPIAEPQRLKSPLEHQEVTALFKSQSLHIELELLSFMLHFQTIAKQGIHVGDKGIVLYVC